MSFIRKNCTIVVLVAIIISSLAVSVLAAPTIYDETNVSEISIQSKGVRGAYPGAEEVMLDTISETRPHYDYVWVFCRECDDDWSVWDISDSWYALDPDRAYILVEYPSGCWTLNNHSILYRVVPQ